jgi:hypothetical protein
MEFGVQFFPDVRPEDKSPADYYRDCLEIAERAEPLGYTHIRIVEHYFHYYGGYSPNPLLFLAAAAQRTKTARRSTTRSSSPPKLRKSTGSATAGSTSVSRARSYPTNSARSACRPTNRSRGIVKASSRSTCCCAKKTSRIAGSFIRSKT